MSRKGSHIYAPVNVSEVAELLGENTHDVGRLCTSDKINPYSLIRPAPLLYPRYDFSVAQMKTADMGDLHTKPSDAVYNWEKRQWGWQVPYVGMPQNVDYIRDISWYRPPLKSNDYKSLNHFDGYKHNAQPMFDWGCALGIGFPISLNFVFYKQAEEVVSPTGKGNNGGNLSIPEIFGDMTYYAGALIRVGYGNNLHWYISDKAITPDSALSSVMLETDLYGQAGTRYSVTPFITNMPANGVNLPQGLRCYGLKFSDSYVSNIDRTLPQASIGISLEAKPLPSDYEGVDMGQVFEWKVTLFNTYPTYSWRLSNIKVKLTYWKQKVGGRNGEYEKSVVTRAVSGTDWEVGMANMGTATATYDWGYVVYPDLQTKMIWVELEATATSTPASSAEVVTSNVWQIINPLVV